MGGKGMEMQQFRNTAILAAVGAGAILKAGFLGGKIPSKRKADRSLVTDFDRRAEEKVIGVIKSFFPDHAILAEESGGEIGDGYTWFIDALDGTTNFVMKNPLFSVAVSLVYRREVILAVVFCPVLGELYRAEEEGGAYLNDRPIRVSNTACLGDATILFNKGRGGEAFRQWHDVAGKVASKARTFRMFGSSAYDTCQVAAGRIDGYVNIHVSSWDSLGPAFIAEEAGGRATNYKGFRFSLEDQDFILTNGVIHAEVLDAIGEIER